MDHPENLTGGRNAEQCINNKNTNNKISKRSNIMQCAIVVKNLGRGLSALLILALIATMAMGQNLVIGTGSTYGGAGTYVVKGNITNAGVGAATAIGGTVTLAGAAAQAIGTGGNGAINFSTLNVNPTVAATTNLNVAAAASTAVNIGTVGTAATLAVGANTLSIGGTSALVNGASALTTAAGSNVIYNSAAAGQAVLGGFTYAGNLTLSGGGAATKSISTATTVSGIFDASAASTLTVTGNLTLGTTGTFAALTNSALIKNGSGLTQFNGAVANNAGGTIDGTVGAGALTFGSTVANAAGTIKGGASLATFSGLLTQTATGILTSGAGGLTLTAGLTNTLGNITLAAGQSMSVSGAQFTQTAGALSFDPASTVAYGAGATAIVPTNYGNLTLNGDAKTWALGAARTISGSLTLGAGAPTAVSGAFALNVGGNVALSSNLTVANAVVFANAASAVTGTTNEIVGTVTRTHAFVAATPYTFNSVATVVTPTAFTTLTSFSMTSQLAPPDPTGYLPGNSVDRKFQSTFTATGLVANVQLGYVAAEYTGSLASKLKFFQGGIVKANKLGGVYTNGTSGSFSYVKLAALASLASGSELAIDDRYNMFTSIAVANWGVASTWDANAVPGAADDVEIAAAFGVTIPTGTAAIANSVLIYNGATGGLKLTGTGTLTVGVGGITNNDATTGLSLVAGTNATINSGTLTNNGKITNDGTITVN